MSHLRSQIHLSKNQLTQRPNDQLVVGSFGSWTSKFEIADGTSQHLTFLKGKIVRVSITLIVVIALSTSLHAQRGGRGGAPATAKQAAGFDMTGYWVSVITEDWKLRMVTPKKGVYETLTLNAEGRRLADTWDPAKDEAAGEQCRAYGAANIMRVPGRLHINWENDTTLRIDTDAGPQTRLFHFGGSPAAATEPAWQG